VFLQNSWLISRDFLFLGMPTHYLINQTLYSPQITSTPNADLGIIVVIPCFNEPNLILSLESLYQCKTPQCAVEIIVVINESLSASEVIKSQNKSTFQEAQIWASKHSTNRKQFHLIYQNNLSVKKAGVGLARKIGMDEAAFRLEAVDNPQGIITGFDADSLCLENYFVAIENHFKKFPDIQAASIWYEHPLSGNEYEENVYNAIAQYELHLRYFTLAKRYADYPHAFETIGSSMVVRADAYQQQGGMNTRKAGEDFYFLNKFIVLGKLNELNTTRVIPSPRISDRVPFGTGKAIGDLLEKEETLTTYAFQSFVDLKIFIEQIEEIYKESDLDRISLPLSIVEFLKSINAAQRITEIRKNTSDFTTFKKRFFRWFDPFMVMKYVHFARDKYYPNIEVLEAGKWILENYFKKKVQEENEKDLLEMIRKSWLDFVLP
jgi:glycosyltransferase involved in cell wall biosynthesis